MARPVAIWLIGAALSPVAVAGSELPLGSAAIERLRWTGWAGLVLALLLGVALWLLARHARTPAAPPLRLPMERDPALPPSAGPDEAADWPSPQAFDAVGFAVIDLGLDLRICALNHSAARLTGWPARDAVGQLVYSVFKARDAQGAPLPSPAEVLVQEGEALPQELCLQARGGDAAQWVEARALMAPEGGALRLVFQPVAGRIQRRERLQQRLRLAEAVLDHLPDAVLTIEQSGLVRSANAAALRLFGYAPEEMLRATLARLLPVPFMNTPGLKPTDYLAGAAARMPKVAGWRKDATTFPAELVVQPLSGDDGERLLVVIRDTTEAQRRQNLAQRLGRLLDAASEEVYVCDAQSLAFLEVNLGARRNLGLSDEELARSTLASIASDLDPPALQALLTQLRNGDLAQAGYRATHCRYDGSHYSVEVRLSYSRDEQPPVFLAIARLVDAPAYPGR